MATQQRNVVFGASPEQFSLRRVHLQTICCHPVANVIDTMSEACNSGCRVTTLTVDIQLRIVSVRMEINVVPVGHFIKIRCIGFVANHWSKSDFDVFAAVIALE